MFDCLAGEPAQEIECVFVCVCVQAGMGVEAKRLFRCFAFIHRGRTQRVKDG